MARIDRVFFGNQLLQIYTNPDCDFTVNHQDKLTFTFTYARNTHTIVFQDGIIQLQNNSGNFSWIQNSICTSMIFEDAPKPSDIPAFSTDHSLKSIGNGSTIISGDKLMKLLASQPAGSIAIGAGSSAAGPGSCAIGNNTFFR